MPSLRQLQYLVVLTETGHFRLAAEKTGVSQPTLSAQIQALEKRLGTQLVERQRSPVVLTPAGRAVLPLAREIMATMVKVHEAARCNVGGAAGFLRVGVPSSIGPYLLPPLLPGLHNKHPALRLSIREDLPASLPEGLAIGTYDLLIAPLPLRGIEAESVPLFRETLFLAVPEQHALASHTQADPDCLKGEPVMALEPGHALNEQVEAICRSAGATILHDFEGTSLATLHRMVAAGLGLAFLPALYAQGTPAPEGIRLLSLTGRKLQRTIGLAWRSGSPLAETCLCIAEHIRNGVRERFPSLTPLS
jgi:LysR family hydrogen peroxide-inducible transcriptional activator